MHILPAHAPQDTPLSIKLRSRPTEPARPARTQCSDNCDIPVHEHESRSATDTEQGGEGRTVALLGGEGGRRGGSCERWLLSETTTTTWLLRVPLEAAGGAREHGSDTATTGEKTSGSRLDGLRLSSCPQQLHHRPP
jgi:hypothetical protein